MEHRYPTISVRELKDFLEGHDDDAAVYLAVQPGWAFAHAIFDMEPVLVEAMDGADERRGDEKRDSIYFATRQSGYLHSKADKELQEGGWS